MVYLFFATVSLLTCPLLRPVAAAAVAVAVAVAEGEAEGEEEEGGEEELAVSRMEEVS